MTGSLFNTLCNLLNKGKQWRIYGKPAPVDRSEPVFKGGRPVMKDEEPWEGFFGRGIHEFRHIVPNTLSVQRRVIESQRVSHSANRFRSAPTAIGTFAFAVVSPGCPREPHLSLTLAGN